MRVIRCPGAVCKNGRVSWTTREPGYVRDSQGRYVKTEVVVTHEKDCPQCHGAGTMEVP